MAFYMRHLGDGVFGDVYKMEYNGKWAAIKKVPKHLITDRHLEREMRICLDVNHNNVVKLLGKPWLAESMWHFPLEFINGETLERAIFEQGRSRISLSSSNKATIIAGMCEGLHYLHKKDIVHQDIKPDNIMAEYGSLRAVIIDLGLAKFYEGGYSSGTNLGDADYSAPEIYRGHRRDMRSDVWAMGKVIGEILLECRLPTRELTSAMIQKLLHGQPYCCPVSRMVHEDRTLRYEIAEVIGEISAAGRAYTRPNRDSGTRDQTWDQETKAMCTLMIFLFFAVFLFFAIPYRYR